MFLKRYSLIIALCMVFHVPIYSKITVWPTSYAYYGGGLSGVIGAVGAAYLAKKYIQNDQSVSKSSSEHKKTIMKKVAAIVAGCVIAGGAVFCWIHQYTPAYLANQLITKKKKLVNDMWDVAYDKDEQRTLVLAWQQKNQDYVKKMNLAKSKAQEFQEQEIVQMIEGLTIEWGGVSNQINDLFGSYCEDRFLKGYWTKYLAHSHAKALGDYLDVMFFLEKISPQVISDQDKKDIEAIQAQIRAIKNSAQYKYEQDQIRADRKREFEEEEAKYKRNIKEEKLRLEREKNRLKKEKIYSKGQGQQKYSWVEVVPGRWQWVQKYEIHPVLGVKISLLY